MKGILIGAMLACMGYPASAQPDQTVSQMVGDIGEEGYALIDKANAEAKKYQDTDFGLEFNEKMNSCKDTRTMQTGVTTSLTLGGLSIAALATTSGGVGRALLFAFAAAGGGTYLTYRTYLSCRDNVAQRAYKKTRNDNAYHAWEREKEFLEQASKKIRLQGALALGNSTIN